MSPDTKSYYEILQVDAHAEQEVIEAAYKRLARKYHPDVDKTPGAQERMKRINEAYKVLSDPVKRRSYDVTLGKSTTGAGSGYTSSPPPPSPPKPPKIRVSKTALDFTVFAGRRDSASFVIENVGGPVGTMHIDWEKGKPDWAELVIEPDPHTVFPVKVTVQIMETASEEHNMAQIVVITDGILTETVKVTATVVHPTHAPRPAPTYTAPPPAPAAPSPLSPAPAPVFPTFPSFTDILGWGVLAGGLFLCISLAVSYFSDQGIREKQLAQVTEQAMNARAIQFLLSVVVNGNDYRKGPSIKIVDVLGNIKNTIAFRDTAIGRTSWSPDGSEVVFQCGFPYLYEGQVCITKADRTGMIKRVMPLDPTTIGAPTIPAFDPMLSPDGTKIVFSSSKSLISEDCGSWDKIHIGVINTDGSNLHWLKRCIDDYGTLRPTWSPDGTMIAFVGSGGNVDGRVYILNTKDLTIMNPFQKREAGREGSPSWSPDGKNIAYGGAGNYLCVISLDGGNQTTCFDNNHIGWYSNPVWSPDGKWLAVDNCDEGAKRGFSPFSVCIISPNGATGPFFVTEGAFPSWVPNSGR